MSHGCVIAGLPRNLLRPVREKSRLPIKSAMMRQQADIPMLNPPNYTFHRPDRP